MQITMTATTVFRTQICVSSRDKALEVKRTNSESCGWPDTTTTHKKCTAHSNMVAEQLLTYGLVERTAWLLFVNVSVMTAGLRVDCAWTVAALGPGDRRS